ncbi:MAG: PHB depolymerase family esterase [Sphingomonadaceae bacterium]|nr:PHB depolymerase family esterase [Sphingomonadaceae bacterium]
MSTALSASFAEALRLTRAGDPLAATRRIQAALGGIGTPAPGAVIELTALPCDPAAQPRTTAKAPEKPEKSRARAKPAKRGNRDFGPGQFLEGRYQGAAGSLAYRLYLPRELRPGMPLLVMLHGCTQSPEDFAIGTGMNRLAEEHGCIVLYPGQDRAANPQRCWNWFRPEDQRRDAGEPALIAGCTRAAAAEHHADTARVFVAGLSAGGAAAAVMAAAYPDVYAAVGIHSGLACGSASDLPSALRAMQHGGRPVAPTGRFVPVITFHGDRDQTVAHANSRQIVDAAAEAAGQPLTRREERGRSAPGRSYTRTRFTDESGRALIEEWTLHGGGHAWSGGGADGSYNDPEGPDASRAMLCFFLNRGAGA